MDKKEINIIIPVMGNSSWIGGLTYQENLIEALKTLPEVNITLTNELENLQSARQHISFTRRVFNKYQSRVSGVLKKVSNLTRSYDIDLQRKLDQCLVGKINAIFTLNEAHLRGKNNIIKLYWIPDFQQIHLKHFFTKEALEKRNARCLEGCFLADIIIVSSKNVMDDLEKFAPEYLYKCRISSFVSKIPNYIRDADPLITINKYSLPEKFFYLPNQLWKHKNHSVVIEALNLLKQEGICPSLVCTGNPSDQRDPGFYNSLIKKTETMGLRKQVRFLGIVPHDDVLILMRQSIAVINPSLFEGWSTTVEEAKSIGKQMIISFIEVHKEQEAPCSTFFDPYNPAQLAEILKAKWGELNPGPDIKMETDAKQLMNSRIKNYANRFVEIITEFELNKVPGN